MDCRRRENRDIPPLDYDRVYRLKAALPNVPIATHGGIATVADAKAHLDYVDGAMLDARPIKNRGSC